MNKKQQNRVDKIVTEIGRALFDTPLQEHPAILYAVSDILHKEAMYIEEDLEHTRLPEKD